MASSLSHHHDVEPPRPRTRSETDEARGQGALTPVFVDVEAAMDGGDLRRTAWIAVG
jgi:hypothetical protein